MKINNNSLTLRTNNGAVIFFDNAYGEMAIMFKGPRGGELGDDLLSQSQVRTTIEFLSRWLEQHPRKLDEPTT